MILKNATWNNGDGRQHKMFVVRSMGAGRGCGILDTYHNTFVLFSDGISREAAKQLLETKTMDDYNQWLHSLRNTVSVDAFWRYII